MADTAFLNRNSPARQTIKAVKTQHDNLHALHRYEVVMRRNLFMEGRSEDKGWSAVTLEWIAYIKELDGEYEEAERIYLQAIATHGNPLGRARTMRQYALFLARHKSPEAGMVYALRALEQHEDDAKNLKGQRQRKITESYVWQIRLMIDCHDQAARDSLIEYALLGCRDCCPRDQLQAVEAAKPYAEGMQKSLLEIRTAEVSLLRHRLRDAARSMTLFVIDTEWYLASRAFRFLFGKG